MSADSRPRRSSLAIQVARVFGIPIRVHASLALLLAWVAIEEYQSHGRPLEEILFVLSILSCVCLHELGHALAARRFAIQTRDIVLYPFGGIASIIGDAKPFAELVIAIAGPLVNVLIALCLALLIPTAADPNELLASGDFASRLFVANVVLVIFNMIPALPMDGGRVFRAILALCRIKNATLIAARVSQVLSLGMAGLAIYGGNPLLLIIAVLVFSQAMREQVHDRALRTAEGLLALDAMTGASHLTIFPHSSTVSGAFAVAVKVLQPIFPVVHNSQVLGLVRRDVLLEVGATHVEDQYLSSLMTRDFHTVKVDTPLAQIIETPALRETDAIVVLDHSGTMVGMLFRDQLLEYLLLSGVREQHRELHDSGLSET